ncbi:MAG: LPS export ABC transporter periplasmic protein LptC [Saprospiraceae bacterium]|nr:LPS export ABC transporter periplasmic protein LptC [Saprospiraceae bacterium]
MKYILVCFPIVFFCTILGCEDPADTRVEYYTKDDAQIDKIDSITILYSDSAKVRLRITAKHMRNIYISDRAAQEFPDGVLVEFFEGESTPQSQVRADYGYRDLVKGEVIFRDHVAFETLYGERTKMTTQQLIWNEYTRILETSRFVQISNINGELVRGYGFRSSQDFKRYELGIGSGRKNIDKFEKEIQ